MIELRNAGYVYAAGTPWAHRALHPLELRLAAGEALLVVGANGSGKSTLAWMLAGLLRPTEGEALIDGRNIDRAAGETALTFQHARLQLFRSTVDQDVAFGSHLEGSEIDKALRLVGLDPPTFRNRRIDELSGGEQRRIVLAGVLARRPRILVLDEPLAGLDHSSRDALLDVLCRLRDETDVATVMVTHDVAGTDRFAGRAVLIDDGHIRADGPLAEIVAAGIGRR